MKVQIFLIFILSLSPSLTYSQQSREYESTHGKEVTDFIAPYLKGYCRQENLDWVPLTKQFLEDSLRNERYVSFMPFMLSSDKRITGNWTYFTAKTPLIYEIEKVEQDRFAVLYNRQHPELILETRKSEWRIALIDTHLTTLDDRAFITLWKHDNSDLGMWDMIYTSMEATTEVITVKIRYVHTGSGGGRDQEFTATISYTNILGKISVKQTKDLMD